MSLRQWLENDWLTPHQPSQKEMVELLAIVDRDLSEAVHAKSPDWRFGIAYNGALKLCTMLLHAEGYRAVHGLQHYRTIMALPLVLGDEKKADATYLDACRLKRNTVEYDCVGAVTGEDAEELIGFARELRTKVVTWLRQKHPALAPRRTRRV